MAGHFIAHCAWYASSCAVKGLPIVFRLTRSLASLATTKA